MNHPVIPADLWRDFSVRGMESAQLRQRREEIVNRHMEVENQHDIDGARHGS